MVGIGGRASSHIAAAEAKFAALALAFFLCKATLCLLSGPAALFVGGLRLHRLSLNNAVTVSMSMSMSKQPLLLAQ